MKIFTEISGYFHRFPARTAAGSFVLFSLLSLCLTFGAKIGFIIVIAAAFVVICAIGLLRGDLTRVLPFCIPSVTAAAAIFVSAICFDVYLGSASNYAELYAQEPCELVMVVTDIRSERDFSSSYDVKIERVAGRSIMYKARLTVDFYAGIARGERISALCTLSDEPDEFDGDSVALISDGFALYAHMVGDYETSDSRVFTFGGLISSIRGRLSEIIGRRVGEGAGLTAALTIGDRSGLPPTLSRDMRRLGTSHLLAISGLHISILISGLSALLKRMRMKKALKTTVILVAIPILMAVTGFSPSVMRCGLMNIFAILMRMTGRRASGITSLTVATAAIILFNPPSVCDLGLLMSVSATYGVLRSGIRWQRSIKRGFKGGSRYSRIIMKILCSAAVSMSAIIYTLPITVIVYGELSLLAPAANLLFIPLAELILILTPFVFVGFLPPLCALAGRLVEGLAYIFTVAANYIARGADFTVSLRYNFVVLAAILTAISWAAVIFIRRRVKARSSVRKRLGLIPIAVFVVCYGIGLAAHNYNADLTAVYINRGKSDGFVLAKGGESVVVDVSDGSYVFAKLLVEQCEAENGADIHAYVLTHLHTRHIDTLRKAASRVFIDKLVLPTPVTDSDRTIALGLDELCESMDIEAVYYPHERTADVFLGDVGIEIPEYTAHIGSAHPVTAFYAGDGERGFVYIGGSVFETALKDYVFGLIERSDTAVMGLHSPVMHRSVSLGEAANRLSALIFADEETASRVNSPLTVPRRVYIDTPMRLFE